MIEVTLSKDADVYTLYELTTKYSAVWLFYAALSTFSCIISAHRFWSSQNTAGAFRLFELQISVSTDFVTGPSLYYRTPAATAVWSQVTQSDLHVDRQCPCHVTIIIFIYTLRPAYYNNLRPAIITSFRFDGYSHEWGLRRNAIFEIKYFAQRYPSLSAASLSASNSAYCYTFLRNVVCLSSVTFIHGYRCHLIRRYFLSSVAHVC